MLADQANRRSSRPDETSEAREKRLVDLAERWISWAPETPELQEKYLAGQTDRRTSRAPKTAVSRMIRLLKQKEYNKKQLKTHEVCCNAAPKEKDFKSKTEEYYDLG